jgi:hypothetical protein
MPVHVIAKHECISSIAARHGFDWRSIWDHPDNQALREARTNPNLLCPGDELVIPAVNVKQEQLASGRQHKVVVHGRTALLRIRLQYDGEPLSGAYVLDCVGRQFEGELDADGQLEHKIPAAATRGTLLLVDRNELIELLLGELDPPNTPTGAVERLVNLGLFTDRSVRELTPELRHALRIVQQEEDLELTGELDDATADALLRWHGC